MATSSTNGGRRRTSSESNERDRQLRLDLEREGRCPDCGIRTHRLRHEKVRMMAGGSGGEGPSSAVIVRKEPLTIAEEVCQGRCLLCHPLEGSSGGEVVGGNNGNGFGPLAPPAQQQRRRSQPHVISQEEPDPPLRQLSREDSDIMSTNDDDDDGDGDEILTILLRMRQSPHDLAQQTSCFHSLWVLSWETENARAIGRVGGIPFLLESLHGHLQTHLHINNRYNRNNHTSSPSALQRMQLQANGLATLQNLSVNKYNKEKLMEEGSPGVPIILMSMSAFLHNAEIVSSGCAALANILSNGACYRLPMLQHGALNVVLRVVECHKDNEGVVRAAYKCMCLLGQKSTARREFQRMERGEEEGAMTDDERSVDGEGVGGARGNGAGEDADDDANMYDMDTSARSALSTCSEER